MANGEVIVRFQTSLPDEYKVPDDDMVLPAHLQRYGMSELINRLLKNTKPVPFDFLMNNKFVRTSLDDLLLAEKKTAEQVMELEYVLAVPPLETEAQNSGQDWISGIISVGNRRAVSSSYDGLLRLHSCNKPTKEIFINKRALTALGGDEDRLVVGAADGTTYFVNTADLRTLATGDAHTEGISTADLSADGATAATGSCDQTIRLWNCDDMWLREEPAEGDEHLVSKKRTRESFPVQRPQTTLAGHAGSLCTVKFGYHKLYSSGLDNTFKIWDLTLGSEQSAQSFETGKPAMSFAFGRQWSNIAMAHEDGRVTMWDLRQQPRLVLEHRSTLRPHKRMCPQVVWAKENENRLGSICHDGTLKILDPRSPEMAIQTLVLRSRNSSEDAVAPKGLCLDFLDSQGEECSAGASDGKVYMMLSKKFAQGA